jgi:hypothetical protein
MSERSDTASSMSASAREIGTAATPSARSSETA